MKSISRQVSPNSLKLLLTQVNHWANSPSCVAIKQDAEKVDRAYLRSPTPQDHEHTMRADVIHSLVHSEKSFLHTLFLAQTPLFPAIGSPQNQAFADRVTTELDAQARYAGWRSQLSVNFSNMLRYNLSVMEVEWRNITRERPQRTVQGMAAKEEVWAGNFMKNISLYDAFWDTSVPVNLIHSQGDFCGYHEIYSSQRLDSLIRELGRDNCFPFALQKIREKRLASPNAFMDSWTYEPDLCSTGSGERLPLNEEDAAIGDVHEHEHLMRTGKAKQAIPNGSWLVTKLHMRIIPANYNIFGQDVVGNPSVPKVFTQYIINQSIVLYMAARDESHDSFPMVFGKHEDDGLNYKTKSFGANLIDYQRLASSLFTLDTMSAVRAINDRAIYDPTRISGAELRNTSPDGKIPVKSTGYGSDLKAAYQAIPYQDAALGTRSQLAQGIVQQAQISVGSNAVRQGQFIRGNKTNAQFQETVGSAESRSYSNALHVEENFLSPIKTILLYNLFQYVQLEQEQFGFSAENINRAFLDFQLADGLVNADRLGSAEFITVFMQTIQTIPELKLKYDVESMLTYLGSLAGAKKLAQFKLSPEMALQRATEIRDLINAANSVNQPVQPTPQGSPTGEVTA